MVVGRADRQPAVVESRCRDVDAVPQSTAQLDRSTSVEHASATEANAERHPEGNLTAADQPWPT
jgi:hypothetical protein